MKYTKEDLVGKILELGTELASKNGTKKPTKKQVNEFVGLYAEAVRTLLAEEGDSLVLQNFNKWEKYESKATKKHNPQNGEIIEVPAKIRVKSKAYFN